MHDNALRQRYQRLLALLEAPDSGRDGGAVEIALVPLSGNNLMILGDQVLFEGMKVGLTDGFDLTTHLTHPGLVAGTSVPSTSCSRTRPARHAVRYAGASGAEHTTLAEATRTGLRRAYEEFRRNASPRS